MLFISHSSADTEAALELQKRLQRRGYVCEQHFLDLDQRAGIRLGDKWETVLYNNLRDCRALLVLCSPNWLQSRWCFAELAAAKMGGKQIFPIVLADCDRSSLAEYQAAFVDQTDEVAREAAFERLLDDLEARGLGPKDHLPWPNPELKDVHGKIDDCPYPGLPAFDERYAAVYFGRESETQSVLEELRGMRAKGEPRILMIVGGSGSGKSSLLLAGVLPRLKHPTSRLDWIVFSPLRFGRRDYPDALFESLAEEIVFRYPLDSSEGRARHPDREALREKFANNDSTKAASDFLSALRDLSLARGEKDATVLLPIDQFEEFLSPAAGENAMKFLRFLENICRYRNDRLLVIGTIRSDYIDTYQRHPFALKSPSFAPWLLEPFPSEQIENVIIKPALRAHIDVTPELLAQLKRDTPTTDALPLLAFTLANLYSAHGGDKKLELSEYQSMGGMEGAIKHAVDQIMPPDSLSPDVESAVRASFVKHLAQLNEKDEFVRMTAHWADLAPVAHPILDRFVSQRLLTKSERDGKITLEVAHEAMFRAWGKLNAWLEAELSNLRLRRKLVRTSEEWSNSVTPAKPLGDEELYFTIAQIEAVELWRQDVRFAPAEEAFLAASRAKRLSDSQREIERLQELAAAEQLKQQAEARRATEAVKFSRQLKWAALGMGAITLLASSLGIWAWALRSTAQRQTKIAEARRLLAFAQTNASQFPERSLLLAVNAIDGMSLADVTGFPEAESFLREQMLEVSGRRYSIESNDAIPITHAVHSGPKRCKAAVFLEKQRLIRLWGRDFDYQGARSHDWPIMNARHLSFSKNGKFLACVSGSSDNEQEVVIWRFDSVGGVNAVLHRRILIPSDFVSMVEFSSEDNFLITDRFINGSPNKHDVLLWSLDEPTPHTPVATFSTTEMSANWAWLDERSRTLACATGSMLYSWKCEARNGDEWAVKERDSGGLFVFENDAYSRQPMCFACRNYNGAFEVVVGWSDGSIELWRGFGRPLRTFRAHSRSVRSLAINPSGNRLASASTDRRVIVWDIDSYNPINDYLVLRGMESGVVHVSFPDDNTVVGCSEDGVVRVWDEFPYYDPDDYRPIHQPREQLGEFLQQLNRQELTQRARTIAGRALTAGECDKFQTVRTPNGE